MRTGELQLQRCISGLILLLSVSGGYAAAQGPGQPNSYRGSVWIDPDHSEPSGTHYRLFPTPSRGPGTEASYLVYLPPDYSRQSAKRFPVLYWLHGGAGSQREGAWMVARIDQEIRQGTLPPFLVVLVQGLPDVRYINSKDGTRPVEDVIIKDLLPHIDTSYRTISDRRGRAIEGMSMGGFGSLRLGFKYPDKFGTVSALAPSITEMKDEPEFVTEPFGNDPAYYEEVGPWRILKDHAAEIHGRTTVRLLVGDEDKLLPYVEKFSRLLTSLNIEHQYSVIRGAHHRYDEIIEKASFNPLGFWKAAFQTR